MLQAFSDLTPEDFDAALVYYIEHPDEIERYIQEHRSAEEDTTYTVRDIQGRLIPFHEFR